MKNTQINNQNKKDETKLIVITRSDISDGYQVVQSTHSVADFAAEHPNTFKQWKNDTNSIICLSVKNEESLLKLHEKLKKQTDCSLFYEPDVDAYTSLCVYGTPRIRKKLSYLPLSLSERAKLRDQNLRDNDTVMNKNEKQLN